MSTFETKTSNSKIFILDDEPHLHEWLSDYLESKEFTVTFETNLRDGLKSIDGKPKYRLLIVDLNVPVQSDIMDTLKNKGVVYVTYPGLYLAERARNLGYRDRQVVVYSVHDIPSVREVTDKIGISYLTKGRPRVFKKELDDILDYTPITRVGKSKKSDK